MNKLAALYIASRIAFNVTYITITTRPMSLLRTLAFMVQVYVYIKVFVQSGHLVALK